MIGETKLSYQLSRWSFLALLVLVVPLVCIPVHGQEEKQKSAVPATPTASDAGVKQDTTAKKAPEQTANTDEIPGLDPKIKELGEAVKKRMNAWSDAETLTLKEGETGRMKVKKNVTPVAEILITPHFAENGIKYDLKGVDAAGKPVAGTERTSLVIPFGQPVSTGLGTSFRIDGKHFMTLVLLKATSQGDRGVVVEAKANFMQVATAEELEAMLLATQGKQGRVKADFMKIDRGISVYRSKTHRYPKNLAELSQPIPKDYYSPTGEIYHYEVQQARYILSSCGPDGVYGNDDDIMEITNRRSVKSGIRQQLYPLPAEKDDDVKAEKEFGEVLSQNYTVSQNGKETVRDERPRGNCSISGKVISATTGKPVESARMYLFYLPTYASVFVNTAGDGTFVFKDIPKGPYSLQVSHTPGYQDASYNPESKPGPFPQFSLKDGEQRTGVDFKVEQAYRISGKILDENGEKSDKIHSLTVLAWFKSKDNKTYENTQAQINPSDGSYTIDGLAGKPTYVMAINWQAAREGNTYPPIYYPGTFSRNDAKLVTFDKKQSVDNVDITLKKEGGLIIEGTVRDEAGKPVPEAFVVVHRRDMLFDFNTAYTDKEGRYQIQGLGDGEFLVHVDAVHRGLVRMRTPVDLGKTSRKTQCDFTLNRGVLISGKFVDEKGNDWQIGSSYGDIHIINKDQKNQPETSGTFSLTNFRNKYRPKDTEESSGGSFDRGEGVYKTGDMLFPTKNTFIIQGMMPGHTMMTFAPQKEGQKVVKILYDGRDIQKSGIETKPGQEIKDVTIVIGKE
jgi:protocatechuate 3,4-dioxygenase beta subunit